MAQQLKAAGHIVGLTILIDSYTNDATYPMPGKSFLYRKKEIVKYQLKTMANMALSETPVHLWKRLKKGWVMRVNRPLSRVGNKSNSNKIKSNLMLAVHLAQSSYVPKEYDGDVSVIRVKEIPSGTWIYHEPGMGWDKLVRGELKYTDVPGNHITFFEDPNIKNVAKALEKFLSEAYNKNLVEV